jgi:mRNA-degrading endonuclease YafQ of YafQ-DinJ toxin-antitoxin module
MTSQFRVLTTPTFERDFRKMSKGNPALAKALEELLAILAEDPHNRSGKHPIKKTRWPQVWRRAMANSLARISFAL